MMRGALQLIAVGVWLIGAICPAAATTYRWIDDDGVVNLSNDPTRFEAHQRRASPDQAGPVPELPPQRPAFGAPLNMSEPKEGEGLGRKDSVTTEVMRLSGLAFQAELLAMMVQSEFERWRKLGFRPVGDVVTTVAQTFSPDTLQHNMHQSLARSLDHERTGSLLAWLRTPLSQRIVSLESASVTADQQKALISFTNQLPSTPPRPGRLALIHRLERAGDVTQGSASMMAAAGAALQRTVRPFVSPAGMARRDLDGYEASPAIDESFRLRIMMSLLFTYSSLSDAELGRYVAVLESPTGRWFTQISHAAFLASLGPPDQPKRTRAVLAVGRRPK